MILTNDRIQVDACDEMPDGHCLIITEDLDVYYAGLVCELPNKAPPDGSIMLLSSEDFIRFKDSVKKSVN